MKNLRVCLCLLDLSRLFAFFEFFIIRSGEKKLQPCVRDAVSHWREWCEGVEEETIYHEWVRRGGTYGDWISLKKKISPLINRRTDEWLAIYKTTPGLERTAVTPSLRRNLLQILSSLNIFRVPIANVYVPTLH